VGATEQLIIASVLGDGIKVFKNIATEPDIKHLIDWLCLCGARIKFWPEERVVEIESVVTLEPKKRFFIKGDRIEAITWIIARLLFGNPRITIEEVLEEDLHNLKDIFGELGVSFERARVISKKIDHFANFFIEAHPFPGFPTGAQPMMAVLFSQ
jgi:UDP-N-acetylglucosamine 1-carboxyvinyltransferase